MVTSGTATATITVTLVVGLPAGGAAIQPSTMTLTSPATLTANFSIIAGPAPVTYTIAAGTKWLTVSPLAGAVLPGSSASITVTADASSLPPQSAPYNGKITVVTSVGTSSKSQSVAVSLTVSPATPTITSLWPSPIPTGSPDTIITVRGTNFFSGTTVTAAGVTKPLKLQLLSSTALLATVPQAALVNAGTVNLTATNPPPAGPSVPFALAVGNAPAITAVANSASYQTGTVSPGEIVSIFGQNLGPTTPVQLTDANSDGFADTSVGGINVLIDGKAAPIIYASNSQVNAQVPYDVTLGTARTVSIAYGAGPAAQAQVDIVAAVPGIFTLDSSGSGAAVVLNYDSVTHNYSVNAKTNPAKIGQIVVFFLTGEGDYAAATYPVETGLMVASAAPQISPSPTISIGGAVALPADLSYAGPIPTCILGLVQINVAVPQGATSGDAVPVTVTIGAASTQAGVTMSVHP
jgi:uncharacterized protein (TIGR03437 family)